jgi:hypothetical protein
MTPGSRHHGTVPGGDPHSHHEGSTTPTARTGPPTTPARTVPQSRCGPGTTPAHTHQRRGPGHRAPPATPAPPP